MIREWDGYFDVWQSCTLSKKKDGIIMEEMEKGIVEQLHLGCISASEAFFLFFKIGIMFLYQEAFLMDVSQ